MSVVRTNASTDELFLTLNGKLSTIFFFNETAKIFQIVYTCMSSLIMIDTQQQYIKINIRGEISIIVVIYNNDCKIWESR
jgi:hypothetical protein